MLAIVNSIELQGLEGYLVSIQVDISDGLPCFEIVGLPDVSVKEAKERVLTAIKNTGYPLRSRRIITNLAPANTRKEGSKFDLAIALGILIASNKINNQYLEEFLNETAFIGELSLDGKINKVAGVLPIAIETKKLGIKRIVIPKQNAKEASVLDGLEILPINNLEEIAKYLNGEDYIEKQEIKKFNLQNKAIYNFDFSQIKGQENVKRALEISAAGGHNCLLIRKSRFWKDITCKEFSKYFTRY